MVKQLSFEEQLKATKLFFENSTDRYKRLKVRCDGLEIVDMDLFKKSEFKNTVYIALFYLSFFLLGFIYAFLI